MDMRKAPNGSSLSFTGRLWQFDDAAAIRRSDKTMQKNVEMLPKFIQTTPCLEMASKCFLACVESQTLWFCCKLALSE